MTELVGLFCHQLPDRSPWCESGPFPLCYRCAGLYLGLFATYLWLAATSPPAWRRRLPETRTAIAISLLVLPLQLDGAANALGWWASPGWLRALTGVGVGTALPPLLAPLWQPAAQATASHLKPTVRNPGALLVPAALTGGLVGLLWWPSTSVFWLLTVAAALGMAALWVNFLGALGRLALEQRAPARQPLECQPRSPGRAHEHA